MRTPAQTPQETAAQGPAASASLGGALRDAMESTMEPKQPQPVPSREPMGALGLVKDADAFLQIALVRLDLLFERDPGKRRKLERSERMLEEVEGMDWPGSPDGIRAEPKLTGAELERVFRNSVELASGDVPGRGRNHGAAAIRRSGPRPLPVFPLGGNARSTGSGRILLNS